MVFGAVFQLIAGRGSRCRPCRVECFISWYGSMPCTVACCLSEAAFFRHLGVFDIYPLAGIAVLSGLVLLPVLWFEHGDDRLSRLWQVDAERTNCDRMAKAFLYVCCCIVWPRFIMTENR